MINNAILQWNSFKRILFLYTVMAQDVQAWLIHYHATTIPTIICTPFHPDARQWYHNSQQYYLKIMTSITANRAILIKVWFIEVWCCDDEFSHEFCWAITLSILSCWYFLSILVGIDVSYQPPKFWVKQWGRFFFICSQGVAHVTDWVVVEVKNSRN